MNKFFTFRSLLAVVAVSGVVQGTASAACWYPDEIVADQVKDFQYMLMVGALQCRNTTGPGNEAYNAFVAQQRNVLDSKGYVLKGHFLRENGVASGREAYDQNNTAMSNRHAGRMDDPSFCQTIAVYTRLAATASDHDFVTLAQAVIEAPVSSCTPGRVAVSLPPVARRPEPLPPAEAAAAADDPYAGEIVVDSRAERAVDAAPAERAVYAARAEPVGVPAAEPAVPVAYAAPPPPVATAYAARLPAAAPAIAEAPPVPVVAPVVAAPPPPAPARRVAVAAVPVTAIADAPVVPPLTAPSPAAALQAAIVALQAAADALRAQSGPTS